MEDVFKSLRRKVIPVSPSFAMAIFGLERPWFLREQEETSEPSTAPEIETTYKTNEKTQVLEGLAELTHKTLEKTAQPELRFPGGAIRLKTPATVRLWKTEQVFTAVDSAHKLPRDAVVFLGETHEEDQAELLARMIQAMKLGERPVVRIPVAPEEELLEWKDQLAQRFADAPPRVVVCLGAMVTNLILGEKERISRIHGTFFSMTIEDKNEAQVTVQMVPVFHPEFLLINPKMKEGAWTDLKKIMQALELEDTI
jgi:hypothetical protein